MLRYKLITTIIGLLLCGSFTKAQTIVEAEQQMVSYLHTIDFWRYIVHGNDSIDLETVEPYDSVIAYNDLLADYLTTVANTKPEMLNARLALLQDAGMNIETAPNNKMRIYSWDTRMGGTMRDYANVIQYATEDGTKAFGEAEGGVSFNSIYHIKSKTGKSYYLAIFNARLSTRMINMGINAYTIENNELKSIDLFHTPSQTYSTISYSYDLYTAMNNDDITVSDVALSNDYQKLYIPVIDGESMTNRRLVYVFDGEKFVFDKHAK